MKVAPILTAIERHNRMLKTDSSTPGASPAEAIEHVLVHTGQHYDEFMSGSFFSDLSLAQPKVNLEVGPGSHAKQTAEIMLKFETVLAKETPNIVLVVGDVNSTVACALTAAKTFFDSSGSRPTIAHVEAGLRSFDRAMPEEVNRIVTDHLSDLLFVTEKSGLDNLRDEGIPQAKIHFVGNTMIDTLLSFSGKAEASAILENLGLRSTSENGDRENPIRQYALLTLHRPSNVDNRETFGNILSGLSDLAKNHPIIFPVHPRTKRRMRDFGFDFPEGPPVGTSSRVLCPVPAKECGLFLIEPLGYLDFLCLMKHASLVVTDSGGIQEETTCLGVPCVTVRENTERPVTLERGTNIIAGTEKHRIVQAVRQQFGRKFPCRRPPNWDGRAAARIVEILVRRQAKGKQAQARALALPAV
jgi:UDP-N-acetylglucosamine 2-epimerase (non-hydrolysing)